MNLDKYQLDIVTMSNFQRMAITMIDKLETDPNSDLLNVESVNSCKVLAFINNCSIPSNRIIIDISISILMK